MQAYRFGKTNTLDGLKLQEEDQPKPQRGEVLLKVRAVALNFRDLALLDGGLLKPLKPHLIPLSDAAADVVAVGEGVEDYDVGDRVVAAFHPRWFNGPRVPERFSGSYGYEQDGWLTQFKALSQDSVVRLPDSISYEAGATLPCAALSAWSALNGPAPIGPGDTVLTLGTGGVSLFALQLAKALGAKVISTTSSKAKSEVLRKLGADEVIDYSQIEEWGARAKKLTGGKGVNRVIEVGGPATINQSLKAIAFDNEIVLIGFLTKDNPGIDYFDLTGSGALLRSVNVGNRQELESLVRTIDAAGIHPVIDSVFDFKDAIDALKFLQEGKHVGKVVIRVAD
jgi:NADPH:quinone reductase-like Zn-dependent oxidoreductase